MGIVAQADNPAYVARPFKLHTMMKVSKGRSTGSWKPLHRGLGAGAAVVLLLFAVSGVALNHRERLAPYSIRRAALPSAYRFQNWNLAAIKGGADIGQDRRLIYGDIGIWRTDAALSRFTSFQDGLPPGMGPRKTFRVLHTPAGHTYAATISGLYVLRGERWHALSLPADEQRIQGLCEVEGALFALTRSQLLVGRDDPDRPGFRAVVLPAAEDDDGRVSLFRTLWVLHSGKILGRPGRLWVDLMGVLLMGLAGTGLAWFAAPRLMRRLVHRPAVRGFLARLNRPAILWHRRLGLVAAPFLLVIAVTGLFLRPPFLLTIVNRQVPAIPHTVLDHPNPWHDQLRDLQWDRRSRTFLFSTSRGFYRLAPSFDGALQRVRPAPPVSVMGVTVFEQPSDGCFLVGSFSGLYRWVPSAGRVLDFITGEPVRESAGPARPFGNLPVAGYIAGTAAGGEFLFLYDTGVQSRDPRRPFPPMPRHVRDAAPLPLWNLALEVHTGRIYSVVLKQAYILVVPLTGLILVFLIVSGLTMHLRRRRRARGPHHSIGGGTHSPSA